MDDRQVFTKEKPHFSPNSAYAGFLPLPSLGSLPPLLLPLFIIYLLLPKAVSNNVACPSHLTNTIKHFLTKQYGLIWNVSLQKLRAQWLFSLLSPETISQQKDWLALFQISVKMYTWILKGPLRINKNQV